ncbi:PepSY domain-containing protein [Nocardiopsis sp. CT-R113]|uniref:PepSY domain-containing protein n=1 Tax=Nocardiopsis codii TaxID=3065942 RepID=A0ABU7K6A0_9ACTN|nr:PepSY domain-containing protein [Nocardiopsis sp. CT-R113]MEE2037379.1 PepSY domain-containing protein [Nocardiopsis sp. CT-R113]
MRTSDTSDPHDPASPAPEPAGAEPGPARTLWASLRPLVLRMHFYAAILVAPFIVVAAVTGLLYVYTPQLEQVVHADLLGVEPADTSVPLSQQVGAAVDAHPEAELSAVRPAVEPDRSTRVLFDADGLPESYRLAVFVNPHTGEVVGDSTSYGSSASLPVRSWLSEFHRTLHLGDAGRLYSELAASWLWAVALGGLALWVARGRRTRRARRVLLPQRSASGRARTLSWHGSVGTWALAGLLLVSATGLTWSQFAGDNIGGIRGAFGWQTPALSAPAPSDHGGHSGHGDHAEHEAATPAEEVDAVVDTARSAGLDGPVEVSFPVEEGAPFTVRETVQQWPVQQDAVAVDPSTGTVVEELRFADYPLMAKLSTWGIAFHMGLLFGVVNQVLLTVLVLSLLAVVFWGYRMWWQRRPTRDGAFATGRPIPRGAWRAVPTRVRVGVVAVAAAVGYLLPVLGVSLLLFLAVDLAVGAFRRREARTA